MWWPKCRSRNLQNNAECGLLVLEDVVSTRVLCLKLHKPRFGAKQEETTMMTYRKWVLLFVDEKASVLLMNLYGSHEVVCEGPHSRMGVLDWVEWRRIRCILGRVCVVLTVVLTIGVFFARYVAPSLHQHEWIPWMLVTFAVVVAFVCFAYAFFTPGLDRRFVKDVEKLVRLIPGCGSMSLPELEAAANALLLEKARVIVRMRELAKHAMDTGDWDMGTRSLARAAEVEDDEFKPLRLLFVKFSIEGEGEDFFLNKAEELERQAEAASQADEAAHAELEVPSDDQG